MVGDVVGGYVVKEALASGRNGLLFLAVHPQTGHRAVVQRRVAEDEVNLFADEAAYALGLHLSLQVERRRSRAGVAVLLAIIDAGAPGMGHTEYTNTQRLPDLRSRAAVPRRGILFGLSLLAITGAALGALLSRSLEEAPQPAPLPVVLAPAPPPKEPPAQIGAVAPTESILPDAGSTKERPSRPPPRAPKAASFDEPSYCSSTDWKPHALADLQELLQRAARLDEPLLGDAEDRAISSGIAAAATGADCRAIERQVGRFHRRIVALEAAAARRLAGPSPSTQPVPSPTPPPVE